MQCTTYDGRSARCVGSFGHRGSYHAGDGVWELPKLEVPNATAALAVLNKNRRTGVPAPLPPVQASDKELESETYRIRRLVEDALDMKEPYASATDAMSDLIMRYEQLVKQVKQLEKPRETQITATELRKILRLPDDATLIVGHYDELIVDDYDNVLRIKTYTPQRGVW